MTESDNSSYTNNGIDRRTVREMLDEADSELDTAVSQGYEKQAKYWLGRKEALQELLDDEE